MAGPIPLEAALDRARRDLLDLSNRNRLLNTPRGTTRSSRLEIVGERFAEVFQRLVVEEKAFGFRPLAETAPQPGDSAGSAPNAADLEQPTGDEPEDADSPSETRRGHVLLNTRLTSEVLQRRLLRLYYDARTYEEEQGVNILFLALGFLKWYEDDASDRPRYAPLLLVPVELTRQSATARFRIRYTDEDLETNLSLRARLKNDFGVTLPDVPDADELDPENYFAAVSRAVQGRRRWEVLADDIVLWFFSFAKFLMYRDLDPQTWPEKCRLQQHPLIRGLLGEGFGNEPPLWADEPSLDELFAPDELVHVLDADSSQTIAIEEARRGRNLVLQGPPGTGKSQTIANLIAASVAAGKRVLFVAEKMAALEVVQRRLQNIGLGAMCLELHSHKVSKRVVLEQLRRTLQMDLHPAADVETVCSELRRCRDRLNRHLQILHAPVGRTGVTPYQALGELVRLGTDGIQPPRWQFDSALDWPRDEFSRKRNLVADLARHVAELGTPCEHPWRGVNASVLLPADVEHGLARTAEVLPMLETLQAAAAQLSRHLCLPPPVDFWEVSQIARIAKWLGRAPDCDRQSLAHPVWEHATAAIDHLLAVGQRDAQRREELSARVVDSAWQTDIGAVRHEMALHGRSWLRIFRSKYRRAFEQFRKLLRQPPPKKFSDRMALLDALIDGQQAREELCHPANDTLGREAFGARWNGAESDWARLADIARWVAEGRDAKLDPRYRQVAAQADPAANLQPLLATIARCLKPALDKLEDLFEPLQIDLSEAFGTGELYRVPLATMIQRLQAWQAAPEGASRWIAYRLRRRRADAEGWTGLTAELDAGRIGAPLAVANAEFAYYDAILRAAFREHPDLAAFDGISHEELRRRFRALDVERIELARREVAVAHSRRVPRHAEAGEMRIIRREMEKRRRHLPIRRLLAEAGRTVQAIKPVFMMSPISVAQYLEPGAVEFDLLLIDEASQVQPVDAFGAIARAAQMVVVGDSKQLPPTRFFQRLLEGDEPEGEDETHPAGDLESILGMCGAQGVPQRMLRWHYRSRHHSLIAVSNREFYDDRLYVFPSPGQPGEGCGLIFEPVSDGVFDRGGSATNRVEARRVAEAVMQHARRSPQQTLGVGTFSLAQRDAILDELERLRRAEPGLEPFFNTGGAEPFFVKNVENIQGDERDVIFISVGYGRDAQGYLSMNFGPLANEGGERRLNVLMTRARDCCRVFSSLCADDIDLNRARSRGAAAFKTFLRYAQSGVLDAGMPTGRDHDSEFERQVARALEQHGFRIEPQVGVAGFFIDLAVIDPQKPGRYLLGIECDGATYHRARWARDRDRLRADVLENRGWILHRIWSTDWFRRPQDELRRVLAAIESARVEWAARDHGRGKNIVPPRRPSHRESSASSVSRGDDEDDDAAPRAGPPAGFANDFPSTGAGAVPYVVASFRVPSSREIHELPTAELAEIVHRVIRVEGPIHRDEIARRVARLGSRQRVGSRIRRAVGEALRWLVRAARASQHQHFYSVGPPAQAVVRDRSEVDAAGVRKPAMLPPAEIQAAVLAATQVHIGMTLDEAILCAARLLGFRNTSPQLRAVIQRELDALTRCGAIIERNGRFYDATAWGSRQR